MENGNNGGGFNVHVYSPGNNIAQSMTVTYNGPVYHGQESEQKLAYTDEEIAKALVNIVGKNKAIDSKQKWAGAQWFLRWECNYPAKALDFCNKISSLPLPEDLEYPCEYNNIRALSTLSFMNEDARKLEQVKYSKNDEQLFFQMRTVVVALREELLRLTA